MAIMPMSARSSSRNGATVRWIGLHTSEGTSYGARGLRDATWWEGSSHAICDDEELLDHHSGCVHPDRYAWTLRSGNPKSVNIEQVAFAKWSRDEWLNNHMPMLRNTARWVADMHARFPNIPIIYIGTQGVRDNAFGVIQHNDYTQGTGDGTHWDCGPGYPIDVVIDLARDIANPVPLPTPVPPTEEDDPMALSRLMQAAGSDGKGKGAIYVVNESLTAKRLVANLDRLADERTLNGEHKFLVSDKVRVVSGEYLAQIPISGSPDPT